MTSWNILFIFVNGILFPAEKLIISTETRESIQFHSIFRIFSYFIQIYKKVTFFYRNVQWIDVIVDDQLMCFPRDI